MKLAKADKVQFERASSASAAYWTATILIAFVITAWVVALVYAKTSSRMEENAADLWSWSCSHKNVQLNYGNSRVSFLRLCRYMVSVQ